MCLLSAVSPQRLAFFYKSLNSLLPIMQRQIVHHESCGSGIRFPPSSSERLLFEIHQWATRLVDSVCDGQRFFLQTLLTHHLTDQSI
ncbi:uncharacterized [Tachysurus ichikawai]